MDAGDREKAKKISNTMRSSGGNDSLTHLQTSGRIKINVRSIINPSNVIGSRRHKKRSNY